MTRAEFVNKATLGVLILSFIVAVLFVVFPMLANDYAIGHSTKFNLSWAFQYQRQFFGGQFYPRWLEFSNYGFGNATFAFYPPLCMVATLPFKALGLNLSSTLIASMALATAVLAVGAYFYSRCFFPRWLSVLTAELVAVSPYFAIDIYHRAAIAEVWGIAILPWILWAMHRLIMQPQRRWGVLGLALTYGLLVLSHLPTLLIFSLVAWVYPICLSQTREALIGNLKRCYGGAVLGLGWTAFFLVPVLLDQKFIYAEFITEDPEYRPQNRLMVTGILSLHPKLTDHWFEGLMLPLWWGTVAIVILTLLYVLIRRFWQPSLSNLELPTQAFILNRTAYFWLGSTCLAVLMTTDVLGWLYSLSPLILERIQFSWRWFSITSITGPLLGSYLIWQCQQILFSNTSLKVKWLQAPILLMFLALMLGNIAQGYTLPRRSWFDPAFIERFNLVIEQKQFPNEPNSEGTSQPFFDWHRLFNDGLALGDVPEYRADVTRYMPIPLPHNQPLASWEDNSTQNIKIEQWKYGFRQFIVNSDQDKNHVLLRMLYYPAWQVQIDGKVVPTETTNVGQIQVTVPKGEHEVQVKYVGTQADWLGRVISGIFITGMLLLLAWWKQSPTEEAIPEINVEVPI